MLGLFMVLPLLAVYAADLAGASAALVGLALGVHGLTQGLLQIPLGWLSDRIGRYPVITGGLLVFIVGSVVAATSTDIQGLIIGRLLQGGGAISAALMALAADYTRETQRVKATAIIGASIGASFVLSLIAGPSLALLGGLTTVFWATAGFGVLGILILHIVVPPAPPRASRPLEQSENGAGHSLFANGLPVLYVSIFLLHGLLMTTFLIVPIRLAEEASLPLAQHWWVYLATVMASIYPTVRLLGGRARRPLPRQALIIALASQVAGLGIAGLTASVWLIGLGLTLFFVGFNTLEASLPALVSLLAPGHLRGTALGVFSSSHFSGVFIGSWVAGSALGWVDSAQVIYACLVIGLGWALMMRWMPVVSPEATNSAE